MATPLVIVWLVLISILGLNACAAGVAAILCAWRSRFGLRGRTFLASTVSGLLAGTWLVSVAALGSSDIGEEPWALVAGFGLFWAVAAAVSVPGALLVARKLEQPRDDYRVFE